MKVKYDSPIGRAIEQYTERRVLEVDVVPDPNVQGCFAVRATLQHDSHMMNGRSTTADFLIKDVPLQRVDMNDLEEVEFTTWPPTTR